MVLMYVGPFEKNCRVGTFNYFIALFYFYQNISQLFTYSTSENFCLISMYIILKMFSFAFLLLLNITKYLITNLSKIEGIYMTRREERDLWIKKFLVMSMLVLT